MKILNCGAKPNLFLVVPVTFLLASCDYDRPQVTVFLSTPIPICDSTEVSDSCDQFAARGVDQSVLAVLETVGIDKNVLDSVFGFDWVAARGDETDLYLNLADIHGKNWENHSSYILETIDSPTAHDTLLALGSNDGAAVWVNGKQVFRSRFERRPIQMNADLVSVSLNAGTNVVLYKILQGDGSWTFLRSWKSPEDLDVLKDAVGWGAFADLTVSSIVADTSRGISLKPPSVIMPAHVEISFKWKTLLGEWIAESEEAVADWLPFPDGFEGAAIVEATTVHRSTGDTLFVEELPVLTEARALSLAMELKELVPDVVEDPVLEVRRALVDKIFFDEDSTSSYQDWLRARSVVDLYRAVYDPVGFSKYSGPQVWGYRSSADGSVQPFLLMVPAFAGSIGSGPLPAVVSMNHMAGEEFWTARGAFAGFAISSSIGATMSGALGIIPHFRGSQMFFPEASTELPDIINQLSVHFDVDAERIGLLAWSQHASSAFMLALMHPEMISHLGLAVPFMGDLGIEDFEQSLRGLFERRQDLEWLLWSGEKDHVVTPAEVRRLTDVIRRVGFEASWVNVPHALHLEGMLVNIEMDLFESVGNSPSGGR